ncbi:hypothetical protein L227DRAFT_578206, partial [Lentinus tigrinus ALCF2SS1-6]
MRRRRGKERCWTSSRVKSLRREAAVPVHSRLRFNTATTIAYTTPVIPTYRIGESRFNSLIGDAQKPRSRLQSTADKKAQEQNAY